jgi:arsenate reductase (thioredoxin)
MSASASDVPVVLFVCIHNAGRSQMAAGLLRKYANGSVDVRSAGTAPSVEINPSVVAVMDEVGVDLSDAVPTMLETESVERADVVVTMGCGDACPVFPGTRYLDWELPDPAGMPVEEVRPIRDAIDRHVQALLQDLLG